MLTILHSIDSLHAFTHDSDHCRSSPPLPGSDSLIAWSLLLLTPLTRSDTHVTCSLVDPPSRHFQAMPSRGTIQRSDFSQCPPEAPSSAQTASGACHHPCDLLRCTPSALSQPDHIILESLDFNSSFVPKPSQRCIPWAWVFKIFIKVVKVRLFRGHVFKACL